MAKQEHVSSVGAAPAVAAPPAAGASVVESAPAPLDPQAPPAKAQMPDLEKAVPADASYAIDMLGDVELDVKVELGRAQMFVEDVLRLAPGSVVELDKLAGDPVDIYVNERLVAHGEVLVVNDNFCVRVNEILAVET